MNPPRDHPSSRGRRSQSQRVSEAVDDVPRRWRPRAPRTGGPGARRSAEKRLRRKRFGYAEAQICTHSRTQATVTRRNRGRSTKSRRRLTPQRGAHAARTLTPFCPLGPKVKFCFHSDGVSLGAPGGYSAAWNSLGQASGKACQMMLWLSSPVHSPASLQSRATISATLWSASRRPRRARRSDTRAIGWGLERAAPVPEKGHVRLPRPLSGRFRAHAAAVIVCHHPSIGS